MNGRAMSVLQVNEKKYFDNCINFFLVDFNPAADFGDAAFSKDFFTMGL